MTTTERYANGSTDLVQHLDRTMQAELTTVGAAFTRAGLKPRVEKDHLELLPGTKDVMIIRVMEDDGREHRVHLRSVVPGVGEVTVSTEKHRNLHKLIKYAQGLKASSERTHDSEGNVIKK